MQVKTPRGSSTSMPLRLCSRQPRMTMLLPLPFPPLGGHRDREGAREVLAGDALLVLHDLLGRALGHDVAAVHPRARAEVDDLVGGAQGLLVVLDDDEGVADVPQEVSVSMSRWLSRWWRPIEGSSRM